MSRATCRVKNLEVEDGLTWIFRVIGDGLSQNRLECRLDQFVHKGWRCVIRPSELSLGAFDLSILSITEEPESPGSEGYVDPRLKLKQTLVDGPEFLGAHVPVVHAGQHVLGAEEAQVPNCFQQPLVRNRRAIEIAALPGAEDAAQSRQT